jgi:hypothetical protein
MRRVSLPRAALRDLLVRAGMFVDGDYWAIGMYRGRSPLSLDPAADIPLPVLAAGHVRDADAAFVADPFMLPSASGWNMFFEVMNRTSGRGEIGLATSPDGTSWNYECVVLAEPFHLSYPCVFEWEGEHFMVPESSTAERIFLYRARRYPAEWELHHVLLSGLPFNDSSLFRHDGRWWMLTETSSDLRSDTLRLYHTDDLRGPWQEHPHSPIVEGDASIARPAGRVVTFEGRLVRYAQDCAGVYGTHVRAFEILELTPSVYRERPALDRPLLGPGEHGWNDLGMHHVDPHEIGPGRWLACVDGRPVPGVRRLPGVPRVQRPRTALGR